MTADDQLEDGTKEALVEETHQTGSPEGADDSMAESTEQGGVEKETVCEVDGGTSEDSSQNITAVEDDSSEVSTENKPVDGDKIKDSENPSGTCTCNNIVCHFSSLLRTQFRLCCG